MIKYEKAGYGYIGKSNYYEEGSNKPRYYGKLTIDDTEFELAGWDKEKDDRTFVSLQVQRVVREETPLLGAPDNGSVEDNDEVPF